jgi:hypothetical protein
VNLEEMPDEKIEALAEEFREISKAEGGRTGGSVAPAPDHPSDH